MGWIDPGVCQVRSSSIHTYDPPADFDAVAMTPMPVDDRPCLSGSVRLPRKNRELHPRVRGERQQGTTPFQDWKMSDRHCASMMQRNHVVLGNEVAARRPTYVLMYNWVAKKYCNGQKQDLLTF